MIEIIDLHKSFGEKKVLNGISFSIPNGLTFCIIGKSGCGKSVLIKHIVGLLAPDEGKVLVDNADISVLNQNELFELRLKMGFVFQGAALFDSLTVFENVVIGLYEHGVRDMNNLESEAKRVLKAVAMLPESNGDESDYFKKEWEILKNKKPSDLSGGMRKRVGVARALVGSPDYIFYDEPTTGLDPVTSQQIDELINSLTHKLNVTSIVITHDMFSVDMVADRVVLLNDGKVQFYGDPNELKQSTDPVLVEFLERYKDSNN